MEPSRIKEIMAGLHLKQKDMADVLGVSLDRVKSLASGRVKKFTKDECRNLVEKLGVSESWLLSGAGPMVLPLGEALRDAERPVPAAEDADLEPPFMGKVLEAVTNAYAASGARISVRNAGEQAMWVYKDIQAALGPSASTRERDGALKMEMFRLRERLSRPASLDESKRSA